MKNSKTKKILSILLTLVMILGMIPATAMTASAASGYIYISGVDLSAGYYRELGNSTPTTTKPEDNYAYFDGTTLELHNYTSNTWINAKFSFVIGLFGYNKVVGVRAYDSSTVTDYDLTIRGNGTLCLYGSGITARSLRVESGNLEIISPDTALNDDIKNVTYPAHAIALCSQHEGGTWEFFDFDKVIDNGYKRVMIISGVSFGSQSPAMPEGETEHDLGTVAASNYPISFQGAWADSFTSAGYTQYETLTVLNSKSQTVYDKSQKCNGEGLTYDLKDLPAGRYVIEEMLTVRDVNDNVVFNEIHTFTIDWTPIINNVNVSATFSGTPADATTSTTGATVTATKWYRKNGSGWTELGASDTIKEGYTYRCEVTVGATGNYALADGYTVKINGIAATKKSGNTWYCDGTITGYTSYVDVYDIALPEAGVHPDFTYNDVDCYHSSVALVEWFECDKDGKKLSGALPADYKFKEDSYYRLEVTAVPDTNYLFDTRNLDFFIGSKAVQYYYPYQDTTYPNSVTGWKVYHVDDANGTYTVQIGDITLKDGDYLANNATSVTTVKPVGGYAYYKDGVLTLNNFVAAKLVRYYERYLEVELIGENKIGAIADYYYWDGNASNDYYTGLEFRGDGNLDFDVYYDKPYSNISVNGDVIFNGSGDILLDAEYYCFQYTDNVIINDGYVSCYCAQSNVFRGNANITVNGGKLQMTDGGSWYGNFICKDNLLIYAGSVYVSVDPRQIELEDCVPWDGVTDLNTYDCVWIVGKQETILNVNLSSYLGESDFITLALYDKNMDIPYYHYTLRGNTTSYSFPAVPYGEYVIVAEKPGHVPYQCTIVAEDDALYQNVELNLYADTNFNGEIDVQDYQALINAVLSDDHEQIETEEYDDLIHYDLVMDGYLDVLDAAFMALVVNGHKTIDEVYDLQKGDYDYDGEAYTESDLIAMYHVLSDIDSSAPTLSTSQKFASDLNYNGKVDEDDLAILTGRYGTIESTTCEENIKVYYRWGNSYTTCTATAICTICDKHVAKETVNSVKNADGSYTATFTNSLLGTKTFKKQ